jgi:hypothetical protein
VSAFKRWDVRTPICPALNGIVANSFTLPELSTEYIAPGANETKEVSFVFKSM